ncbi:MAG: hypothetical protein NTW28_00680 [Candidatus Solibacter sp.]|nr:hypothetical protein [Candidatus Solibacter sp.]
MANIYFCGHGAWATTGASTGFTHLPPGTTLRVYTPVGRFLSIDQATAILRKDQGALTPDQTFSQYQSVTDLTLSPCPEHKFQFMLAALSGGVRAEMVEQDRTLAQLAAEFAGNDLHWLACRIRFGGLDTTEGGFNDDV